ncbi:MAG: hypothetical protein V4603_08800 [Pseudomonadota bacterium]
MKTLSLKVAIKAITLATVCSLLTLPATAANDDKTTAGPMQQRGGPGMRQRGGPGQGRGLDGGDLIERADSNDDGKISVEEFLAPRLERLDDMFERRDANGDGLIAEGEGRGERPAAAGNRGGRGERAQRGGGGGRPGRPAIDREAVLACMEQANPDFDPPADRDDDESRFDAADTNGDGSLSLSEVTAAETARAEAQFDKLDADADGFITTADIEANQEQRAEIAAAMRECMQDQ